MQNFNKITPSKSVLLRHEQCPRCASRGNDNSKDNLAIYKNEDGQESSHCFSCGYTKVSSDFKKESYEDRYEYNIEMSGEFTIDYWNKFKNMSGQDPRNWRGLSKEACAAFRC